jgi:hypothetical protein
MIPALSQRCSTDFRPVPRIPIWQWAEENCDFARAPSYETPLKGPYKVDVAPYTKQLLDWCQDPEVREIVVRKCSRAGVSEAVLMWLRWIVSVSPMPTYYLTADQLLAERFMKSRIKRGWAVCRDTWRKYKEAQSTEHDIRFAGMDFRISWPNAKGAFKQDGWAAIVADEFSTWKEFAADMLRKRAGTYRFHTIFMLSSPDPTRRGAETDPIISEYEATDQNLWTMKDPKTGTPFVWEFGGVKDPHGLKWPDDARDAETGQWDLERVRTEAYYLTPDGTRIENDERVSVSADGVWVPSNDKAPTHVRGAWIVGPMVPFLDGDFGVLAYRFLEAKRKGGKALRSYFYENWADVGDMPNSDTIAHTNLRGRELEYVKGSPFFDCPGIVVPDNAVKGLFLTADVQKYHIWWVTRWWMYSGERCETGLESWGNAANFTDLNSIIDAAKPNAIGIDIGGWGKSRTTGEIHPRFGEVVDFCADTGAIALKGSDSMKGDLHFYDNMDPTEGRKSNSRHGAKYSRLEWNTDIMRGKLLSAMRGETPFAWHVYRMPERDYVRQVMSTEKVDGEWRTRKGFTDDHLFDCEAMQFALARFDNFIV